MASIFKRPISANFPHNQQSRQSLSEQRKYKVQVCQSQNLNNSEVARATQKLPFLLMKLKLEELGFRAHQYNQHINQLEELDINSVPATTLQIVNAILNQQRLNVNLRNSTSSVVQQNKSKKDNSPLQQQVQIIQKNLCSVCFQLYYNRDFITLECGHKFCKDCISGHIKNSIDQAKYEIPCPQFQCLQKILDENIKKLITQQLYDRYHYFKRKKQIQRNPNNKFCSVPNCEGILEEKQNIYLCPQCKADYCLECLRPKHQGDCSSKIQQIIDRSYQDYNIKKCPSCRAPIQKMDGCNHMTCKNCNYQFCWLCLGKYTKYHYRYFNCCGCPGMQFENQQDRCCQRFKQLCVFIILPPILLLIVLTVCTLLPFYLLGMMFIKPIQKAMQFQCLSSCCGGSCSSCKQCIDEDDSDCDCCTDCCAENELNIAHFFVGLLMLPYGILYGVTVAPIKFFIHVWEFIKQLLD